MRAPAKPTPTFCLLISHHGEKSLRAIKTRMGNKRVSSFSLSLNIYALIHLERAERGRMGMERELIPSQTQFLDPPLPASKTKLKVNSFRAFKWLL